MHESKYGHFIENGCAYAVTDPRPPMPWTNVVCNGRYGFVVSQSGGGFSWLDHCQLNVVTRWDMDLIRDDKGRFVYVRDLDDDSGAGVWSLSPMPCMTEFDSYRCVHRPGSTTFETEHKGIRAEWTMFVAADEPGEIWTVRLTNTSDRPRRLRVASYLEWCCGAAPDIKREFHRLFFDTRYDAGRHVVSASKCLWEAPFGDADDHWNRGWPHVAAMAAGGFDAGHRLAFGDKRAFLGRFNGAARPEGLLGDAPAVGEFGRFGDAACALGGDLALAPGQTKAVTYSIAVGSSDEEATRVAHRLCDPGVAKGQFDASGDGWEERLTRSSVDTDRSDFDLLNNTWLPYQAISARLWGRTGYYQQSGAFGFRDQLQDSQVWLPIDPAKCAEQILLHSAHQFADGTVYHWWNPITETGNHTKCSDDYLWLPFVTGAYVRETGDASILDRVTRFVDDEAGATVLEHCRRAIERSFARFGPSGLPLIGDMDWNDGLSALGTDDAGESVWLAMFLVEVLDRWAYLLELAGADKKEIVGARKARTGLMKTINDVGWDGAWYRRATNRRGEWLGSSACDAGRIFLNAQSWAILTATADEDRAASAWGAVREHLVTDYGPLLLAPAYTDPDPEVGYITRYAPGARENGGVYMHAATWALAAACKRRDIEAVERIWDSVSPPVRGGHADAYQAEPYVLPGNVDGPLSDLPGRAGWTWYTGSAAWLNRVCLEEILGIRPDWGGLRVDPCPVRSLGRVEATRVWRGRTVRVRFDAGAYDPACRATLVVNGRPMAGQILREDDLLVEGTNEVEVSWSPAPAGDLEVKAPVREGSVP